LSAQTQTKRAGGATLTHIRNSITLAMTVPTD